MSLLGNKMEVREFALPLTVATVLVGGIFAIFTFRLWQLQLLRGEEYRHAAEIEGKVERPKPAPRGMVLDTNGRRLADNRASFDLKITPHEVDVHGREAVGELEAKLSPLIGMSAEEIDQQIQNGRDYNPYLPAPVKRDLTWPEVAKLETFKADLPGVEIEPGIKRTYLYGDLFAHVIGYLGEVGEKELPELQKQYGQDAYQRGSYVGKGGVELLWETRLKGKDGQRVAVKDRLGKELSAEEAGQLLEDFKNLGQGDREEIPGDNVRLSIDLGLQQEIARVFGDKSGAVVVLDVRSGAIRALFSHPAYDPEIFARGITQEEWEKLSTDPDHPLEDKAIRGMYPPGSTFKLIVAAAGLGTGVINPKTTFSCNGHYHFGNRDYRCWNARGHGTVDLHKAIQQSCDVYFYNVAQRVGIDRLAAYARSFGLGEHTGIGMKTRTPDGKLIDNEKTGLIPTTEWKRMHQREEWQDGETLSAGIGQGFDLVTPLQLGLAYAAIANGGKVLEPHLVEQVVGPDGKVVETVPPKVRHDADITPDNLKLLQDGLFAVVNEPGGTGYYGARIEELHLSGKTGTAQVIVQKERDMSLKLTDKNLHDHAWFVAYAPSEDPQIAMAVLVEHGDHGATAAAPVARAICEYWFRDRIAAARAEKGSKVATAKGLPSPSPAARPTATPSPAPENDQKEAPPE